MERKRKVLIAVAIIIAVLVLVPVIILSGLSYVMSRASRVDDPEQAKANGRALIKQAKVVVAVGAHPDDLEYYTGGTLGTLAKEGKTVIGVTVADLSDAQDVRRAEGREAAETLGYKPVFLGHPEREYENGLTEEHRRAIRRELTEIFRKAGADTVLCYDYAEQGPIYHHIDHIFIGEEAQAAAKAAGVEHVYLYSSGSPDTLVDISPARELKVKAISAHVSQQNRRWIRLLRTLFNWLPSARQRDNVPGLSGTESFRKL